MVSCCSRCRFMFVFLLLASLQMSAGAINHTVDWIIPSNGATFYVGWAANQNFLVGDNLVFNFTTGSHDVAKVSQTDYGSCNTSVTSDILTKGPATVTLNSSGQWHFTCSFKGHCDQGQKLAVSVNVLHSPAPVLPPAASASPPVSMPNSTPPEGSSSAPSGTVMPPSTTTLPPASTTLPSLPASPVPVAAPGPATLSAASAHSVCAAAVLAFILAIFLF